MPPFLNSTLLQILIIIELIQQSHKSSSYIHYILFKILSPHQEPQWSLKKAFKSESGTTLSKILQRLKMKNEFLDQDYKSKNKNKKINK